VREKRWEGESKGGSLKIVKLLNEIVSKITTTKTGTSCLRICAYLPFDVY